MARHTHRPVELPQRQPRSEEIRSFVVRRWRYVLVVVTFLVAGFATWLIVTARPDAEHDALLRMAPEQRRALYEQTLRSTEALCAQAAADDILSDRCIDGARFLLAFPECDKECITFTRRHRRPATR